MASPDKPPLDREVSQYVRPEHKMEAYRMQRDDALAELVRLRPVVEAAQHLSDIYGQFGTGQAFWESFERLDRAVDGLEVPGV